MSGIAQQGTTANAIATFLNPRVTSLLTANQQAADEREKLEKEKAKQGVAIDLYSKGIYADTDVKQSPKLKGTKLFGGGLLQPKQAPLLRNLRQSDILRERAAPDKFREQQLAQMFPAPTPTGRDRYVNVDGIGLVDLYDEDGPKTEIVKPEAPAFKAGQTRSYKRGRQEITEQWDGEKWVELATSGLDKPGGADLTNPEKTLRDVYQLEKIIANSPEGSSQRQAAQAQLNKLMGIPASTASERDKEDGLKELEAALNEYTRLHYEYGGETTVPGVRDNQVLGDIRGARAAIMIAIKKAEKLGTLDQGLLDYFEEVLEDPTGIFAPFSGVEERNKGQLIQLYRKLGLEMPTADSFGIYDFWESTEDALSKIDSGEPVQIGNATVRRIDTNTDEE